jgi:uncharacterized protein YciI
MTGIAAERTLMFILSLTYVKPNEEADKHMEPHMAWVKEGYAKGWFLASGRKVPRTGGVILSLGNRAEIEAYVAADPFTIHAVAQYDITEIAITTTADGLDALKR